MKVQASCLQVFFLKKTKGTESFVNKNVFLQLHGKSLPKSTFVHIYALRTNADIHLHHTSEQEDPGVLQRSIFLILFFSFFEAVFKSCREMQNGMWSTKKKNKLSDDEENKYQREKANKERLTHELDNAPNTRNKVLTVHEKQSVARKVRENNVSADVYDAKKVPTKLTADKQGVYMENIRDAGTGDILNVLNAQLRDDIR